MLYISFKQVKNRESLFFSRISASLPHPIYWDRNTLCTVAQPRFRFLRKWKTNCWLARKCSFSSYVCEKKGSLPLSLSCYFSSSTSGANVGHTRSLFLPSRGSNVVPWRITCRCFRIETVEEVRILVKNISSFPCFGIIISVWDELKSCSRSPKVLRVHLPPSYKIH